MTDDDSFDVDAWLRRIGHAGPRAATLPTLRAVIAAHTATIAFENADVLLGRPPKLDLASLQRKLVASRRGGYCFELNSLLYAGLAALGFRVTRLIARVIRGMAADAPRPATHMLLRVDLPEGPFLADVGFGIQTPTAPLEFRPDIEQQTPHEAMRLLPVGEELVLQAKLGQDWSNLYRISPHPRLAVDFDVANWFTATHPASPFLGNLVAARPGPGGTRQTFLNGRVTVRGPDNRVDRFMADGGGAIAEALTDRFGLVLSGDDLAAALAVLDREGTRGAQHPSFS
jgi:N-hydroxyarylamine O-acetyltransferase